MNNTKTRFAPSPTGMLHVGGLRTALFAYLFAKQQGGTFALRIEDTDRTRFVEGATEHIVEALHWAGMPIDEGVDMDEAGNIIQKGEHGPYIQSERTEKYREAVQQLLNTGHAYYAFDTPEALDEMRKRLELNKMPTIYDRDAMTNSLTLGDEETQKRIDAGEKYVIRLKVPQKGETIFTDMVRGDVTFQNKLIDDQILMKSDEFPTYHLANVVDDHDMGITHVIRGEEWLPSTPKHIMLYKAFGWDAPTFAHLSLLVNEQKQKLSKRHGDVSVGDFMEKGYLSEAMINFLAFLGWNPGDEREIFSLSELEAAFDFEKVGKAPSVFNREKLNWYNKQYMMEMDMTELATLAKPFFEKAGIDVSVETLAPAIDLERSRVDTLSELPEALENLFRDDISYEAELLVWKKSDAADAKAKLTLVHELWSTISEDNWNTTGINDTTISWIKEHEYGVGDVLWPTRVSLSGKKNSPGPFELASVLGKARTLSRIQEAINKIG